MQQRRGRSKPVLKSSSCGARRVAVPWLSQVRVPHLVWGCSMRNCGPRQDPSCSSSPEWHVYGTSQLAHGEGVDSGVFNWYMQSLSMTHNQHICTCGYYYFNHYSTMLLAQQPNKTCRKVLKKHVVHGWLTLSWPSSLVGMSGDLSLVKLSNNLCTWYRLHENIRTMVANAKKWAETAGLMRTNPIHGKMEYRIPLTWNFTHTDSERAKTTASLDTDLEAGPWMLTTAVEIDGPHLMRVSWVWLGWQGGEGLFTDEGGDLNSRKLEMKLYSIHLDCKNSPFTSYDYGYGSNIFSPEHPWT